MVSIKIKIKISIKEKLSMKYFIGNLLSYHEHSFWCIIEYFMTMISYLRKIYLHSVCELILNKNKLIVKYNSTEKKSTKYLILN